MKKFKGILALAIILIISFMCVNPIESFAAEKPIKKEYIGIQSNSGSTKQYKVYRYTYKKRWTKNKVLKGQPIEGSYLRKNGEMFYLSNNKGIVDSVSVGGVFSISVPLGQRSSKSYGVSVPASKNGYYLLQNKRLVKPTEVIAVEYRERTASYLPWGSWKKCRISRGSGYILLKDHPSLKRVE